jgi:hypothetical protein
MTRTHLAKAHLQLRRLFTLDTVAIAIALSLAALIRFNIIPHAAW